MQKVTKPSRCVTFRPRLPFHLELGIDSHGAHITCIPIWLKDALAKSMALLNGGLRSGTRVWLSLWQDFPFQTSSILSDDAAFNWKGKCLKDSYVGA